MQLGSEGSQFGAGKPKFVLDSIEPEQISKSTTSKSNLFMSLPPGHGFVQEFQAQGGFHFRKGVPLWCSEQ
jgi:hypothetical protein